MGLHGTIYTLDGTHTKLWTDLSSERSSPHKEGSFQLRVEEVARLAKFLGVDMSRISELLGKDITRLSKLVDENMKMNTRVNLGDARSGGYQSTDERVSDGKRSGASNQGKKEKGKGTERAEEGKAGMGDRKHRGDVTTAKSRLINTQTHRSGVNLCMFKVCFL